MTKRFSSDQKRAILQENATKGTPISVLARLNGVHPITLYNWKRQMSEDEIDIKALLNENAALKKEKDKLLKLIGEEKVKNDVAQDIIEFYKKKTAHQQLKDPKNSSRKTKKKSLKK